MLISSPFACVESPSTRHQSVHQVPELSVTTLVVCFIWQPQLAPSERAQERSSEAVSLQVMSSESRSIRVPSSGTKEYNVETSLELEPSSDCGMGFAFDTAERIANAAKDSLKKLWTAILELK